MPSYNIPTRHELYARLAPHMKESYGRLWYDMAQEYRERGHQPMPEAPAVQGVEAGTPMKLKASISEQIVDSDSEEEEMMSAVASLEGGEEESQEDDESSSGSTVMVLDISTNRDLSLIQEGMNALQVDDDDDTQIDDEELDGPRAIDFGEDDSENIGDEAAVDEEEIIDDDESESSGSTVMKLDLDLNKAASEDTEDDFHTPTALSDITTTSNVPRVVDLSNTPFQDKKMPATPLSAGDAFLVDTPSPESKPPERLPCMSPVVMDEGINQAPIQIDDDSDDEYSWLVPDGAEDEEGEWGNYNENADEASEGEAESSEANSEPEDGISLGEDEQYEVEVLDVDDERSTNSWLAAPKAPSPKKKISQKQARKIFLQNRDAITQAAFQRFNTKAFGSALSDVEVTWTKTLNKTAGLAKMHRKYAPDGSVLYFAKIELSSKVLDNKDRLESTLLHEMCHAAAWIVDHNSKPPHGPIFKKWGAKATKATGIPVTTTHDYEINYKFAWACLKPGCGVIIKRHSRSFDTSKYRCGKCKGSLVEVEASNPTQIKKRTPVTAYQLFVKQHSKQVRDQLAESNSKVTQAMVSKEVGRLWKLQKENMEP